MNKKQWKAIYDFCEAYGYQRPSELLQDLKIVGIIDKRETLDDLGEYPNGDTYEDMINWLKECF